jgi:hypothetical protein
MATSAIADASAFLYRHPWTSADTEDPKEIIEGLLREALTHRTKADELQLRVNKAEAKALYLVSVLEDLMHNKARMSRGRLREVFKRLTKIETP